MNEVKRYAIISDDWDYVESPSGGFVDHDDYAALEAECKRLRQFEVAYNDWQAKTDWVQESAKPHELGRHRADVLRARIEALAAQQGEAVQVVATVPAGCKVVPVELLERLEHVTRTLVPHLQCHVELRALLASVEGGE